MKKLLAMLLALLLALSLLPAALAEEAVEEDTRPRTIVTTDGEVDDMDTFMRFLLYSNEFDIEGIVYSASQWHYAGDGQGTLFTSEMESTARMYGERTDLRWCGTDWIQEQINLYAKVYANLVKHDPNYPTPGELLCKVAVGNIEFEGEMEKDTDGSNLIKSVLLDDDDRPVYLQVWGGTNTIARALKSIEDEYKDTDQWEEIYRKVSDKAIIYTILDQDMTYQNYVSVSWPEIRVMYNSNQFWTFAYSWRSKVPEELHQYLDGNWFIENIKFEHGDLLETYMLHGDGYYLEGEPDNEQRGQAEVFASNLERGSVKMRYDFISEGDTPAFLYLCDFGFRCIEDPSYGGWGGRLVQSETNPNRWEDGEGATDFNYYSGQYDTNFAQARWVAEIQNDFAARADWCVMGYEDANHAPEPAVEALDIEAYPGQKVLLNGSATDPDGDALDYKWWNYFEADTYQGNAVTIFNDDTANAGFVVPTDAQVGDTINILFEVTDNGTPALTRYEQVIVTVIEAPVAEEEAAE